MPKYIFGLEVVSQADVSKIVALVRVSDLCACQVDGRVGWIGVHGLRVYHAVADVVVILQYIGRLSRLAHTAQQVKDIRTRLLLDGLRCI